jgi:uncharacterized protein (DUF433 family)
MELSMVNGAKPRGFNIYGGTDPAELPRYTRIDASRATGVPASTIGVWVHGMPYTSRKGVRKQFEPVVALPDPADSRLSFNNLLEVNVLRALRGIHEVQLRSVRTAIENAKRDHGIERLLIHPRLRTSGGALFLDYYFKLVDLSNSKQLALRSILEHSLQRVEVDEKCRALNFFPFPRSMQRDERPILVSPYVSFGGAILQRRGISTNAIAARVDSGEDKAAILADYDLTEDEFEEAILYEAAA